MKKSKIETYLYPFRYKILALMLIAVLVNSYSLSDDSGVMAAAAITHFLFGQAVFSYLNGWSVLIGPGTSLDSTGCKYARDLMGLVAFTAFIVTFLFKGYS